MPFTGMYAFDGKHNNNFVAFAINFMPVRVLATGPAPPRATDPRRRSASLAGSTLAALRFADAALLYLFAVSYYYFLSLYGLYDIYL